MAFKSLTFGAVLWDVVDEKEFIGGAPFNLAAHLKQLEFDSYLLSCIGEDERGYRIIDQMNSCDMKTDGIQISKDKCTGFVDAVLDRNGIPEYKIPESVAFDDIQYNDDMHSILLTEEFDLFCFGSFDQRSEENRKTLYKIKDNIKAKYIFCDINLREPYYTPEIVKKSLNMANLLKVNDDECVLLSEMLYEKKMCESEFIARITHEYKLQVVVITKGKKGCSIWQNSQCIDVAIRDLESETLVSTIGAGDAFCAGFLLAFCQGEALHVCGDKGNTLGSYVAQSKGAVPQFPEELKKFMLV